MTDLNDIAKENDVNLENSVVFVRGEDDILSVDLSNAGIKQRSDDTMGFTFSITPKQALDLEEYFSRFAAGEKFYYDISQTGYRPAFYRGLSSMTKEISEEEDTKFNITLFAQKAIVEAEDSYFTPTCVGCAFCHIGL
ncbi:MULTISPECIES: hypothetical protein [unclassified Methanobrevibacter]|uniref:hypothetical protein n=1 Tax=unclassified Methanobrevibacter TaxID=2638681 RepID=UPI0027353BA6|nr:MULTISPECIES: hypothetical protein [unclassified Methanobrevibacter]